MDRAHPSWRPRTSHKVPAETSASAGFRPSANARRSGRRQTARPVDCALGAPPPPLRIFRLAHGLIGKPLHTFPGHALSLPVQYADQREEPARGFEIDPHLALQPFLQRARTFVMDAATAHVDGLDLVRRSCPDRLV